MSSDDELSSPPPSASTTSRPRRPTRPPPPAPLALPNGGQHSARPRHTQETVASQETTQSPVSEDKPSNVDETQLTPLRAHYLKKTLIALQLGQEIDGIANASHPNVSTLSYLGSPFTPPPRDAPHLDLPFLKYMFRQFVLSFPFLAAAPKDFFPEKLQPFIMSVLSRNLSGSSPLDDNGEEADQDERLKLLAKIEKNFSFLLSSGTKLVEEEQVVRLTQADLNRLEMIAKKRQRRLKQVKDLFEVNIVCVRAVINKGRMRTKMHEEFIIRTRRTNCEDVFVSRRYGDFKSLSEELRKRHPEEEVKSPPGKDKSVVTATASTPPGPLSPALSSRMSNASGGGQNASQESLASLNTQQLISGVRLAREKNRLTLRAYLHSLLTSPVIAASPVFRHFLLSDPTRLSSDEVADAKRREEADKKRDEGRIYFAHEIAARVEGLRSTIRSIKGDILQKDGLSHIFDIIRKTPDARDLPEEYRAVLEWGRISFASTIFQNFIAADDASEKLAGLKRLHGLMPYFVLKGILKISNPVYMIRSGLDLFTARPFGGQSLLQRMFTSSLQEEVKACEDDIEIVKDKVDDPVICEKVRQFIYAPLDVQAVYRADAASEGVSLLTAVLRSGEQPALNRPQLHRVMRAHHAHNNYTMKKKELEDSDDDSGPDDEEAWLYEDLILLGKLYARLRDRQQTIELIFEGNTADVLKDIITIFYSPLAQVYKAASIGDSLSDLQNFINDLIRTVEQADEMGQDDPQLIVKLFIDLVQRHEQAFYSFVHKVHSKGESLFDSLMKWVELFLTNMREGLGEKISLEFLLPHTGQERVDVLREVDAVALHHYRLKLQHEDKLRRRFGRAQQAQSGADAEDDATQAMLDNVMRDLSFGELVQGDAEEIVAAESNESDESSTEYETASDSESGSEESSSEEESEDVHPAPKPSMPTRSSTMAHPTSTPNSPQRFPNRSDHQRSRSAVHSSQHHHHTDRRGITPSVSTDGNPNLLSRSRTRSMTSLKNMLSSGKNAPSSRAPPVPALARELSNSSSKPLPPRPSSEGGRSSAEGSASPRKDKQLPKMPQLHARKPKDKVAALTPPELHHIPTLLPVFVEIMRPLLRPTAS